MKTLTLSAIALSLIAALANANGRDNFYRHDGSTNTTQAQTSTSQGDSNATGNNQIPRLNENHH